MSRSIKDEAEIVARFVARKILQLQGGHGKAPTSSSSRATLARLRRLGMPGCSWMAVGSDLFDEWPEFSFPERCRERNEERVANAIVGTLRLYAYHQQSKQVSMTLLSKGPESGDCRTGLRRRSFGWSCWLLEPDPEKAKGIRRRMASIEATNDFEGMEHHLRGLVMMMRSKDVKVDYWSLARDLYLMQFESAREGVFIRWAQDYYAPKRQVEAFSDLVGEMGDEDGKQNA